jgi:hypothetical protein
LPYRYYLIKEVYPDSPEEMGNLNVIITKSGGIGKGFFSKTGKNFDTG